MDLFDVELWNLTCIYIVTCQGSGVSIKSCRPSTDKGHPLLFSPLKSCAHRADWRLQPSRELFALVSPPLMSSRHHNLEPYRRWHATIHIVCLQVYRLPPQPNVPGDVTSSSLSMMVVTKEKKQKSKWYWRILVEPFLYCYWVTYIYVKLNRGKKKK